MRGSFIQEQEGVLSQEVLQKSAGVVHTGGQKHPDEVVAEPWKRQRCRQFQQTAGRLIPYGVFEFFTYFPSYYFNRSLSLAILAGPVSAGMFKSSL